MKGEAGRQSEFVKPSAHAWAVSGLYLLLPFMGALVVVVISTFNDANAMGIGSGVVAGTTLLGICVSRAFCYFAKRREFLRGYTTLRAYSGTYTFFSAAELKARPIGVSASAPAANVPPVLSTTVPEVRRNRVIVGIVAAVGVSFLLGIASLRLRLFDAAYPVSYWDVLILPMTVASAVAAVFIVVQLLTSMTIIHRVRRNDTGHLFVVYATPDMTRTLILSGEEKQSSLRYVLAVDIDGIRLWTTGRVPRKVASLAPPSSSSLKLVYGTGGFSSTRPLLMLDDSRGVPLLLSPHRSYIPSARINPARAPQVLRRMKSAMQLDGSD